MARLLVCGADFGWGSAGKLSAVIEALRMRRRGSLLHVTGIGTALGRRIIPSGLVDTWIDTDLQAAETIDYAVEQARPDACLVILDPLLADALAATGRPVIYVDSLPHLWTEHDPLPQGVTRYCAQRTLAIPPAAERVLARLPTLSWVDPIISPSLHQNLDASRDDRLLLVNVGGIHAPLSHATAAADYLSLVLPPLVMAAEERGARRLLLAGNVCLDEAPPVEASMAVELLGPSHREFLSALAGARWVATSPGLTTLLEIAALGRTAALLPPQNLSQFHHLNHLASIAGPAFTMPWPTPVLDPRHVRRWHRRGEDHALARIYATIASAAAAPSSALSEGLYAAACRALIACESQPSAFHALAHNCGGAMQVAQYVDALLSPPRDRPTTS